MTHRSAAVASLIVAAVFSPIVAAQQPAPPAKSTAPTPAASSSPFGGKSRETKTFDVTFGGGTLEQYIETLRAASKDEPVNVMLAEDARNERIPALNLKGVSVYTAINSLESVSRSTGGYLTVASYRNQGDVVIYSILSNKSASRQQAGGNPSSRLVVSLSNLVPADLDAAKRDERLSVVLSAIEAALRLGRPEDADAPAVALHKESGLLMVLGSAEDRQTVESVIQQLKAQQAPQTKPFTTKADLFVTTPGDALKAIREVFAEPGPRGGPGVHVEIESPKSLVIAGTEGDVQRTLGIVAYVDRDRPIPAALLQMNDKVLLQAESFNKEAAMLRDRQKSLENQTDELRSRLANTEPQLAAAKAREETLLREIADLRMRLRDSETRLVELSREKNAGKP